MLVRCRHESELLKPEKSVQHRRRLFADLVDTGGEEVEVSFLWGTDPFNLNNETNVTLVSSSSETSSFLSGLTPDTQYYFPVKSGEFSWGFQRKCHYDLACFHWELNDTGSVAIDQSNRADGLIYNASSILDSGKGTYRLSTEMMTT